MSDDFDASALLIACDLVEQGGMPDQAEQLRALVRERAWPARGRDHLAYFAALHDADPHGDQSAHEADYPGYRRVAIPPGGWSDIRGPEQAEPGQLPAAAMYSNLSPGGWGWRVSGGSALPRDRISFPAFGPAPDGRTGVFRASHLSIGTAAFGPGRVLATFPLTLTIAVGPHSTPSVQSEIRPG